MLKYCKITLLTSLLCLIFTVPAFSVEINSAERVIPLQEVQNFLQALHNGKTEEAAAFCDETVIVIQGEYNDTEKEEYELKGIELCNKLKESISQNWIEETSSQKLAYCRGRRFYHIPSYFETDSSYFVLGDTEAKLPSINQEYIIETFGSPVLASGWLFFIHEKEGKWLIYKAVKGGIILE